MWVRVYTTRVHNLESSGFYFADQNLTFVFFLYILNRNPSKIRTEFVFQLAAKYGHFRSDKVNCERPYLERPMGTGDTCVFFSQEYLEKTNDALSKFVKRALTSWNGFPFPDTKCCAGRK